MQKAVSYVRVSSKEQHEQGYSPDAQKRLLYEFARSNGFNIVEEFEDAETAKQTGRTAFTAILAYVREHGIKHILVEKTDRLHRNFVDYVKVEDLIKECDVTVYLVKEGTSLGRNAKSSDKFMHGIRTLMAKNFIDNLSEETRKGMDEKVAHGEYPSKAPLGYLNVQDPITKKNIVAVDHKNRALIEAMFTLYGTGNHSLQSLIDELECKELTGNLPNGRKLNKTTTDHILRNPFYIGHFQWNKEIHKGAHEAIIDSDTWQRVQDVLNGKREKQNYPAQHNVIPFPFKGVFTCGECQRSITAEIKKGKYIYYRCTKYQTDCTQQAVKQEMILEEAEEKILTPLSTISDNGIAYVVEALKQSLEEKRGWHNTAYEAMLAEKTRLKNRLDRMYEDRLDEKVTEEFYETKRKEYTDRLTELDTKIAKHDRADINYHDFGLRILELAKNAKNLMKIATPQEQQELLKFLLSNSTLKDGKPDFSLKKPFLQIAKRSPLGERSAWGD